MADAVGSSPQEASPPPTSRRLRAMGPAVVRAVRRVADYLRTLGLTDRVRVRALSQRIVFEVNATDPDQLAAQAVAAAQARFEEWRRALESGFPERLDPLWLRDFISARPELFLGDAERARIAAANFGDPLAGKAPKRVHFRPQAFEPARLPSWLRGLLPPFVLTFLVAGGLARALAANSWSLAELCWLALFVFLFGQAAIGLCTALLGFATGWNRRRDEPYPEAEGPEAASAAPASTPAASEPPASPARAQQLPRTAVLMPIYHENTEDVFAAVAGMGEALAALPEGEAFELFVLSDSRNPQICTDEERAFRRVAAAAHGVPIYYHRRAQNERQKAGNLAEFFERWAPRYEYAITLDADSVMTGELMIEMVRRMRQDDRLALLQAPLALQRGETLFARALAFSTSVCGPNFTRGLALWSDSSGNYYGHNALLRVRAFLDCCQLPKLHGEPPFGGHVLSHDFVEAALLCRAGWHVRIAHDLGSGSYEELPATLHDFVARDRRWCQGNLQHLRIAPTRGLVPMSRIHLLLGAFSYLAGPAWFAFILLGLALWQHTGSAFRQVATLVSFTTLLVLLGPWLLGTWSTARDAGRRRAHGGAPRLWLSTLLGVLLGALLAPLLMLHHTRIVSSLLMGHAVGWDAQRRHATSQLSEVLHAELPATLLGSVAAALSYFAPNGPWLWLAPVWVPWLLSIPVHAAVSSQAFGQCARKWGLLTTPSESEPEPLLRRIDELRTLTRSNALARFRDLVLDPVLLAAHLEQLHTPAPSRKDAPLQKKRLVQLRNRALQDGPLSLMLAEWRLLAADPESMQWLHREAWQHWPVESWNLGHEQPQLPPEVSTPRPRPAQP